MAIWTQIKRRFRLTPIKKVMLHVVAIGLLIFGLMGIHIIMTHVPVGGKVSFYAFGFYIDSTILTDFALLCLGIAFLIEFALTFKPIKVVKEEKSEDD